MDLRIKTGENAKKHGRNSVGHDHTKGKTRRTLRREGGAKVQEQSLTGA
jgi:hypothetical protein